MKILPLLGWFLASPAVSQLCSDASCFGPANVDPVVITNSWALAPGANLDFGPRHVILASDSTLFLNGPATILAAKITGQPESAIDGTTVPGSNLSITTAAAGGHDGSATFSGTIDLSGSALGDDAGHFTLTAGGSAIVQSLTLNGGGFATAGSVTIIAAAITVGTIAADVMTSDSTASIITLTSPGHVSIGTMTALAAELSTPAEVFVTAGSYQQTGDIVARPGQGGTSTPLCTVAINVSGAAGMSGSILAGGGGAFAYGGWISVIAGGALQWNNAVADVSGVRAGSILVRSLGSDVSVSGSLIAQAGGYFEFQPGHVSMIASRDLDFTGLLDVSADVQGPGPTASLSAGGLLTVHPGSLIVADYLGGGCAGVGGLISLSGCRITIASTASVHTCGTNSIVGASVSVSTSDVFTLNGSLVADPVLGGGGVFVTSRLALPWAIVGTGTSVPPAVVTVDPGIPPCLANATTVFSATSVATAGQPVTISVDSAANKPLLIVADTSVAHLPLGALGWTQVNVLSGFRVADAEGFLGSAIPTTTNTNGHWSLTVVTPATPVLSNIDVFFDAYVFDAGATNGIFHQPPFAVMHFN